MACGPCSALPNGSPAGLVPASQRHSIETHGPYQHGAGFPAVNGAASMQLFSPLTPPSFRCALLFYGLCINTVSGPVFILLRFLLLLLTAADCC